MIGHRLQNKAWDHGLPKPGAYWKVDDVWYGCCPNGLLCNLKNHNVIEHQDGSITVTPSILVKAGWRHEQWHGYLTKGEWLEA